MSRLVLLAFLVVACGANHSDQRSPGAAGAAGENSAGECERAGFLGRYVVSFQQIGGDCGLPQDDLATIASLESVEPCQRVEPDDWSADACAWTRRIVCGDESDVLIESKLVQQPDGSLSGTERRTVAGVCSGEYTVTLVRE